MELEKIKTKADAKYLALLKVIKPYLHRGDTSLLRKAYESSLLHLGEIMNDAGQPLVFQQLDIALILAHEMGMGMQTVLPAFVVELLKYEKVEPAQITSTFGETSLKISQGLLSIENLNLSKVSTKSENFHKLLISLSNDIRGIFYLMAKNLYDLRHYSTLSQASQQLAIQIARDVSIPFAHRLGLYNFKTQLENDVMQFSEPEVYQEISRKIEDLRPRQQSFFSDFIAPIHKALSEAGIECEFKWRFKTIPSIYQKIKKQKVNIEEVYDLFAVRIILTGQLSDEKAECWRVYSIVSNIYTPDTSRLRDWITLPRPSGYESLHTTVMTPQGKFVEVQIRTRRMDEIAEMGDAAHWNYKEAGRISEVDKWLSEIREVLESHPKEETENLQIERLKPASTHIFVLTPTGDVKELPQGATVLDFAYEIHSSLGDTCTGARVNNKVVPIKHQLNNGDKIEILTSKNQFPKLDWLQYCSTSKARNKIRKALSEDKLAEAEQGKSGLLRHCRKWKVNYNDEMVEKLLKHFKIKTALELYASLARSDIEWAEVKDILTQDTLPANSINNSVQTKKTFQKIQSTPDAIIIGDETKNIHYTLARCCSPIYGDEVFGFITVGRGITIHRKNCPNALMLQSKHSYRIIEARWFEKAGEKPYQALLRITGDDRIGLLADISHVLTDELKVNILSVNLDSKDGFFDGKIKIQVSNIAHLDSVIHRLMKIKSVARVKRFYD